MAARFGSQSNHPEPNLNFLPIDSVLTEHLLLLLSKLISNFYSVGIQCTCINQWCIKPSRNEVNIQIPEGPSTKTKKAAYGGQKT